MIKRFTFWGTIFCFISLSASAYKFICNGYTAEGNEESDECGVCTDDSGPRWIPSNVNVLIDLQTRPANISKSDWKDLVLSSMESWNKIPGANLKMIHAGDAVRRGFGTDSRMHEIFWVTEKQEWRQKVGAGENGALGVTLTPYQCPTSGRLSREIYDADLIMNAVGKFKWSVNCRNNTECDSIRSTLTHELGHFIGIGHPCPLCSWSIMSAQAGYDIEYPVFDDQEAARALYPGQQAGQIGTRCESSRDCESGLSCISQNDTKYCSRPCSGSSCPEGYACDFSNGDPFCRFAIGRLAGAVGLHERCETRPCDDGLQCVETFSSKNFCMKDCKFKVDCFPEEECVLFPEGGLGVCLQTAGLDESCGEFTTCKDKMLCIGKSVSEGVCKWECRLGRRSQCRSGDVCTSVGNGLGACLDENGIPNIEHGSEGGRISSGSDIAGPLPIPGAEIQRNGCSCMSAHNEPGLLWISLIGIISLILAIFLSSPKDPHCKSS